MDLSEIIILELFLDNVMTESDIVDIITEYNLSKFHNV